MRYLTKIHFQKTAFFWLQSRKGPRKTVFDFLSKQLLGKRG